MEIILVVLQPKQNIGSHDYRSKFYNVLLLDHKTSTGDKSKPTKYLPTFPLTNTEEEPRDEVLTNLYQLTGGDHGGIKGERAILIPWNDMRASLARFYLFCVPVNSRDKLSKTFVEKSPNSPGFYALDVMIDSFNTGMINYPPPTQTFISRLESWLKDKHSRPGSLDILFQNRADYRIKFSINNPAFLPSRREVPPESNGIITDVTPDDIRLTANEALAKELAMEKCDIVVINPIFGSQMPYKTKVNNYVRNVYWPSAPDDYDSRRSSDTSSMDGVGISDSLLHSMDDQFHRYASEGNCDLLLELINRGFPVNDKDLQSFTPLHYSSVQGHVEAVEVLLRAGANPNARTNNKATALHLATMYGNVHVAEVLLRNPLINVDLQDRHGKTALRYCEETQYLAQKRIGELIREASKSDSEVIEINMTDKVVKKLKLVGNRSTTVKQLNLQLFREFNMPDQLYSEIFTIWICSSSLELQLKQDHCPMKELLNWNKLVKMLTDASPGNEVPQLRWRRNAKVGLKEEKGVNHPQAIHILFHEAYNNYIQALYPCKEQDVLTFASILIYMEQKGEYDPASAKSYITSKSLQKLVPGPMLKAKNWASRILHHYKEFCSQLADKLEVRHGTQQQREQTLKRQFLEFCRNLTVYGSAFFRGMLLSSQTKGGQSQTACHIGVNDVGIHIINTHTRVMLHSFKYSEIKWKHEDGNSLEIIVVRLDTNVDKNLTQEVKLRTKQAWLIHDLMEKLKQMHAFQDRSVNLVSLVYSRSPTTS